MVMAVDEDGLQRREYIGAVADLDHLQRVQRIDHRTRPDRNPGGAQRAGKADDVVGLLTGLRRKMIDGHRTIRVTTLSRHSAARAARTRNLEIPGLVLRTIPD